MKNTYQNAATKLIIKQLSPQEDRDEQTENQRNIVIIRTHYHLSGGHVYINTPLNLSVPMIKLSMHNSSNTVAEVIKQL